jgi:hypothetical protein
MHAVLQRLDDDRSVDSRKPAKAAEDEAISQLDRRKIAGDDEEERKPLLAARQLRLGQADLAISHHVPNAHSCRR